MCGDVPNRAVKAMNLIQVEVVHVEAPETADPDDRFQHRLEIGLRCS
jgi:hypothetical protein